MIIEILTGQAWRPNLFIAGFRCGTTEFWDYLSEDPDIFLPFEKEHNTFWDPAKCPAYLSGDCTGNLRYRRILSLNECYEMFSKGKKYTYGIDPIPSYTFALKFACIFKSYSDIIKLITDTVSSILDKDYRRSINFAVQKRILVCLT